jgi:hypothetical protein
MKVTIVLLEVLPKITNAWIHMKIVVVHFNSLVLVVVLALVD